MNADANDDRVIGGAGNDTLNGGADEDRVEGGEGDDRIDGGKGSDRLLGGAGDDYIGERVSAEDERMEGGDGDDYIFSAGGNDRVLLGGAGNDVLKGGLQIPTRDNIDQFGDGITDGGTGNDIVLGGGANDLIFGGDGDDSLYGGARLDRYDCGPGNDVAYVENTLEGAFATLARLREDRHRRPVGERSELRRPQRRRARRQGHRLRR